MSNLSGKNAGDVCGIPLRAAVARTHAVFVELGRDAAVVHSTRGQLADKGNHFLLAFAFALSLPAFTAAILNPHSLPGATQLQYNHRPVVFCDRGRTFFVKDEGYPDFCPPRVDVL